MKFANMVLVLSSSIWYPELKRYLAPPRTFTTPESHRMPVYDAFALLYSYFTLNHLNQPTSHENQNNE